MPACSHAIADWADRYTPLVGRNAPDGLMLDITGAAHLLGGEAALQADLADPPPPPGLHCPHRHRRHPRRRLRPRATWRERRRSSPPTATSRAALAPLPIAGLRLDAGDRREPRPHRPENHRRPHGPPARAARRPLRRAARAPPRPGARHRSRGHLAAPSRAAGRGRVAPRRADLPRGGRVRGGAAARRVALCRLARARRGRAAGGADRVPRRWRGAPHRGRRGRALRRCQDAAPASSRCASAPSRIRSRPATASTSCASPRSRQARARPRLGAARHGSRSAR